MAHRFNTYCPFFVEGSCSNACKYKYHIRCNANLTCFNSNCQYGHTISFNFRKLFKQIVNENLNTEYENSKNKCFFSINCLNSNCHNVHMLNKDSMIIINHILKEKISYEDSLRIYELHFRKSPSLIRQNSFILPAPPIQQRLQPLPSLQTLQNSYDSTISQNPPEQPIVFIDPVLENNLLKLTETDDNITQQHSDDFEDVKFRVLQELMVLQNNIKLASNEVYNKDVLIFNLMHEKQLLEAKMCKDKLKVQNLMVAIKNMEK
jgi:hypothetical protein